MKLQKTELNKFRLYKPLLWKTYFDKGFSLTNYFKYFIFIFGWATSDVENTIYVALVWCVICLILGKFWFRYGLVNTEQEIQNRVNPFVKEMRDKFK